MTHIGTIQGTGRLLIDGADAGSAAYRIRVYSDHSGMKSGLGTIKASNKSLWDSFNALGCTLEIENGGTVEINIKRWRGDEADITTSGPVPGF